MEKETNAAMKTGRALVGDNPMIIIPIAPSAIGMGTMAAGTATIIQPRARPSGIWGKIRLMAAPRQEPTKRSGKIGPPMKPKFNAPLRANSLTKANITRSRTPIWVACWVTMDISVVPRPILDGMTTASKPSEKPPKVLRKIGLLIHWFHQAAENLVKDHKYQGKRNSEHTH